MAATEREIQQFRNLIEKGVDQDRAKRLINEAKTTTATAPREGLAQRALVQAGEFIGDDIAEEIPETEVEQIGVSTVPSDKFLGRSELENLVAQRRGEQEEADEGFTGFISETGEALKRRAGIVGAAFERGGEQRAEQLKGLIDTAKTEGVGAAIFQGVKQAFTPDILEDKEDIPLQIGGQVIAGGLDIVWEGLENLIQEFTPADIEQGLEDAVASVGKQEDVQKIVASYQEFKANNPERARNLEGSLNIAQIIPVGKVTGALTRPFRKTAQVAAKKTAEQGVKDLSRGLLNLPGKFDPTKELSLGKFFADKVKPTPFFDDVAAQFDNIGRNAINKVNSSLKSSTTLHKPQGAKEVLKAIKENLKNIPFATTQKKVVNELLKKFNKTGLTLADLNKIKRSINEYTRAWTSAGKDAAGLAPDAMRGKYTEIRKFIENIAQKEGLPDIRQLNQDWIQSNELFELLSKQATSIGKKEGLKRLTQGNIFERGLETIVDIGTMPLRKVLGKAKGIADIDLIKALKILKETNKATQKVPLLETLGKSVTKGKEGLGKAAISPEVKNAVGDLVDELARKTGGRADFLPELLEAPIRVTVGNLLDVLTGKARIGKIGVGGGRGKTPGARGGGKPGEVTTGQFGQMIDQELARSTASIAKNKARRTNFPELRPEIKAEIDAGLRRSKDISEKALKASEQRTNLRSQISQIEDLSTLRGSVGGFKILDEPRIPQAAKNLLRDINTLTPDEFASKMSDIIRKAKFKKDIMPVATNIVKLFILSELGVKDGIIDKLKEAFFQSAPELKGSTPRG